MKKIFLPSTKIIKVYTLWLTVAYNEPSIHNDILNSTITTTQ